MAIQPTYNISIKPSAFKLPMNTAFHQDTVNMSNFYLYVDRKKQNHSLLINTQENEERLYNLFLTWQLVQF